MPNSTAKLDKQVMTGRVLYALACSQLRYCTFLRKTPTVALGDIPALKCLWYCAGLKQKPALAPYVPKQLTAERLEAAVDQRTSQGARWEYLFACRK